ncbi:hypothetical protein ACTMU2_30220 [Cupriavidus basilensis]
MYLATTANPIGHGNRDAVSVKTAYRLNELGEIGTLEKSACLLDAKFPRHETGYTGDHAGFQEAATSDHGGSFERLLVQLRGTAELEKPCMAPKGHPMRR